MFDAPLDAWYVWLGLSVASLVVFGVTVSLPATPPPDAAGIAETVDRTAAADYGATATRSTDATAVRLETRRLGLRNDAGSTHAAFSYPVVPVREGTALERVLRGDPPGSVFDSGRAFQQAAVEAQSHDVTWQPAGNRVVVRHVVWEGVDVTLVSA